MEIVGAVVFLAVLGGVVWWIGKKKGWWGADTAV